METQYLFEQILKNYSSEIQEIAREMRVLIFNVFPETVEVPWIVQKIIGYGVGPKKMSEHFCWIQINKAHVNLGFNFGVELPDTHKLLEGRGKRFRHKKIQSLIELQHPGVRQLIEDASQERLMTKKVNEKKSQ